MAGNRESAQLKLMAHLAARRIDDKHVDSLFKTRQIVHPYVALGQHSFAINGVERYCAIFPGYGKHPAVKVESNLGIFNVLNAGCRNLDVDCRKRRIAGGIYLSLIHI